MFLCVFVLCLCVFFFVLPAQIEHIASNVHVWPNRNKKLNKSKKEEEKNAQRTSS